MAASSEVCLELKSFLQFISDHLSDGQGGACSRWRGIAYVQNPASQLSLPTVKHKIIHQVSFSIQSLCTHTRRPPAQTFTSRATVIINENMYHFYNFSQWSVCVSVPEDITGAQFRYELLQVLYLSTGKHTSIYFSHSIHNILHYQPLQTPTHTHTQTHTPHTPTERALFLIPWTV